MKRTYRKLRFLYQCDKCFFSCENDEERMKSHILKVHGITGMFSKGYKAKKTHRIIKDDVMEPKIEVIKEKAVKTKRYYQRLRNGIDIPEGAIIHISKNGIEYYEKIIGEDKYI